MPMSTVHAGGDTTASEAGAVSGLGRRARQRAAGGGLLARHASSGLWKTLLHEPQPIADV